MLDTGAMQPFLSGKIAAKLLATVQTTMPLNITLPTGKILIATLSIQLDILIDVFIYS